MNINGFSKNELFDLIWTKPTLAQIELTRKCNQNCCFCFQGCKSNNEYNDLSLDEWKLIIKKLKSLGVNILNFSGGEVFLYSDFIELLDFSKNLGFKIVVNTNGTIDVTDAVKYIDELIFSIHGLPSTHNLIVGNTSSFNKIEKNVSIANSSKTSILINMTIIKENFNEIEAVFNYFNKKYNIDKFSPTIAIQSNTGSIISQSNVLDLNSDLFKEYFSILDRIPPEKLNLKHGLHCIYNNNKLDYKDSQIKSPNCIGGKFKLIIQYDGSVYPCNFFLIDDFYCGNILTENEFDIWKNGKGFNLFRNLVFEEKVPDDCKKCIKLDKCYSGCRAWTEKYRKGFSNTTNGGCIYNEQDLRCKITNAFIGN